MAWEWPCAVGESGSGNGRTRSAFRLASATRVSSVSYFCAVAPWVGMFCTRVPVAMAAEVPRSRVNVSHVVAASPGARW